MYAVIETGGKQYRVKEGDIFYVEKLPTEKNTEFVFDQVLLISSENGLEVGAPLLEKARVACEVLEQFRGKKILVYKVKRRKKHRRRKGHRQYYTRIRVLEIAPDGNLTGKKAAPKAKKETKAPIGFENTALEESSSQE